MLFNEENTVQDLLLRVELLLVAKNIPKEQFYAESGISSASFSQWKSGKYAPSINKIYQMANYLDVSAEYLLGTEEQKKGPPPAGDELSEVKKKVLDRLNKMSDQEVQKVIELLDVLDPMFK